jgi:fibronectin type 3 domain-containing protein
MKKFILSLLCCLAVLSATAGTVTNSASVTVGWDAVTYSPQSNLFYKVYVGTSSRNYITNFPTANTSQQITNLSWGSTYYYAVTAVGIHYFGTNGQFSTLESAYSVELTNTLATIPSAPTNLRIVGP